MSSIFEPTGIADSDFLGRRLVRKDFINAMVKWRQGVIYGQWRIHESDFLKIEISVPSVEEQRKIGAYLDQLDNLITLHQRQPIVYAVIHSIRKANLVERQYFAPPMVRKFLCSLSANNLQYYSKGINAIVMQALGKTGVLWRRTAP